MVKSVVSCYLVAHQISHLKQFFMLIFLFNVSAIWLRRHLCRRFIIILWSNITGCTLDLRIYSINNKDDAVLLTSFFMIMSLFKCTSLVILDTKGLRYFFLVKQIVITFLVIKNK